jgi:hypothetical protein
MAIDSSKAAVWFGRVMWLGIFANLALAIPTIAVPATMLRLTGLPSATPLLWVQFSAVLLVILSLFYMPPAIDPYGYRAAAWLSVLSRLIGAIYFSTQTPEYRMFGLFDFVFFVPQAFLLTLVSRSVGPARVPATGASLL